MYSLLVGSFGDIVGGVGGVSVGGGGAVITGAQGGTSGINLTDVNQNAIRYMIAGK